MQIAVQGHDPVGTLNTGGLELCTERHLGQVVFSCDIQHAVGRTVRSLYGKTILGDAFLTADVQAMA